MAQKFDFKKVTPKGEFKGAVHVYTVNGKSIAVGFTTTEAFIMQDELGLYELNDIKHNINHLGLDTAAVQESKQIYGICGAVEPLFTNLGFSEKDKEDIRAKLGDLNELEKLDGEE